MAHINPLLLMIIIFISCQNHEVKKVNNINTKQDTSIQNNDWKRDSEGCLKLRTLDLANELITKNDLLDKSTLEFRKLFGEPNVVLREQEFTILIYYSQNQCIDSVPVANSDKCWIQFKFKENKLVEIPKVFACE